MGEERAKEMTGKSPVSGCLWIIEPLIFGCLCLDLLHGLSPFSLVVDPTRRRDELNDREDKNDQEQDPRHGRGISHVVKDKSPAIEVEHVEERCIGWTTTGHDISL